MPIVTTAAVTSVTETSAVTGGNVTSDGNASVTERGVVYSTNPNPVITNLSNTIRPCGSGTGEFTYTITGLQANTKYYVRAYAKNDAGTAYGEEISFVTNENTSHNGYEYVDLGLSVKWATMNVGAEIPEDYGDYFAWGETAPKEVYDRSTYKWCNGSKNTLTKYNTISSYGIVDNKTQLELSDDAASVNWGGSWRIPTNTEMTELREQCTWTWITQNGVNGYKVTSKSNGNSIFLPAAGYYYDNSSNRARSYGYYWSSLLSIGNPDNAWFVYYDTGNKYGEDGNRYYGRSIRAVFGEYKVEETPPIVTTTTATSVTETSAVTGGNVTSDGNASVTERGVVYATTQNPTTSNTKVTSGSGTGSFTCNLSGLQPNTTYYVRAYAINSKGTAYGSEITFTTKSAESGLAKFGWQDKNDMFQDCMADCGVTGLPALDELKAAGTESFATICYKLTDVSGMMELQKWDWLTEYIMTIQNADPTATALVAGTSSAGWRHAVAAFFLESQRTTWPKSADFSEAGKVEAFLPYIK